MRGPKQNGLKNNRADKQKICGYFFTDINKIRKKIIYKKNYQTNNWQREYPLPFPDIANTKIDIILENQWFAGGLNIAI